MSDSERYEKLRALSESRRRGIFARFFRGQAPEAEPFAQDTSSEDSPYATPPDTVERKPSHYNRTIVELDKAQTQDMMDALGIETGPDHLHIIHYVGGSEPDSEQYIGQTFTDYAKDHDLTDSRKVASLYTGDLSKDDISIIRKLLGYHAEGMTDDEIRTETDKLSPSARTLMEEVFLPGNVSSQEAVETILEGHNTPITFYHNIKEHQDIKAGEQILFWIDETYGGKIALSVGPSFNDTLAGPMADGQMEIYIRETLTGRLYWNTWQSNAVRWSADPFLRKTILRENPDNQTYINL